jgi:hypothetical protein
MAHYLTFLPVRRKCGKRDLFSLLGAVEPLYAEILRNLKMTFGGHRVHGPPLRLESRSNCIDFEVRLTGG